MDAVYLQYLLPLEVSAPAAGPTGVPNGATLSETNGQHREPAAGSLLEAAKTRGPGRGSKNGGQPPPVENVSAETTTTPDWLREGPPELTLRLARLESALAEVEQDLADLGRSQDGRFRALADRQDRLDLDLDLGRAEPNTKGAPVSLSLGFVLIFPMVGIGINAAMHFGLYQLFLRLGDPGLEWAQSAAEVLLGFQLAAETTPHAYFYWMAVEFTWTSLVIGLGLFLGLRWAARYQSRRNHTKG